MRRTIIRTAAAVALAAALAVGGAAIAAAATPAPTASPTDPALGGIELVGGTTNGLVSHIPGPVGDVD